MRTSRCTSSSASNSKERWSCVPKSWLRSIFVAWQLIPLELEESELWTGKSERSERDDGIWEIYREYVSEDTFFSGTLSTNPKFWGRNGPHGDQSSEWWKWPSSYELVYTQKNSGYFGYSMTMINIPHNWMWYFYIFQFKTNLPILPNHRFIPWHFLLTNHWIPVLAPCSPL